MKKQDKVNNIVYVNVGTLRLKLFVIKLYRGDKREQQWPNLIHIIREKKSTTSTQHVCVYFRINDIIIIGKADEWTILQPDYSLNDDPVMT